MLAVMVRFRLAAVPRRRTKVQLAVLMLLASWLKGSGEDDSFSNEVAKWPTSTFWHMLKSFGNVASGLYFALPLPLLLPLPLPLLLLAVVLAVGPAVPLERPVNQRTPAAPRPRTSRTATVPATRSAAVARRAGGPRPRSGGGAQVAGIRRAPGAPRLWAPTTG